MRGSVLLAAATAAATAGAMAERRPLALRVAVAFRVAVSNPTAYIARLPSTVRLWPLVWATDSCSLSVVVRLSPKLSPSVLVTPVPRVLVVAVEDVCVMFWPVLALRIWPQLIADNGFLGERCDRRLQIERNDHLGQFRGFSRVLYPKHGLDVGCVAHGREDFLIDLGELARPLVRQHHHHALLAHFGQDDRHVAAEVALTFVEIHPEGNVRPLPPLGVESQEAHQQTPQQVAGLFVDTRAAGKVGEDDMRIIHRLAQIDYPLGLPHRGADGRGAQQLGDAVARPHDLDAQVAPADLVGAHIFEPLQLIPGVFVLDLAKQQFSNAFPIVGIEHPSASASVSPRSDRTVKIAGSSRWMVGLLSGSSSAQRRWKASSPASAITAGSWPSGSASGLKPVV